MQKKSAKQVSLIGSQVRFQIGSSERDTHKINENWVRFKSPQSSKAYLLAGFVGLLIPSLLIFGIGISLISSCRNPVRTAVFIIE